jgi:C4-dicarboxylate-specific signal transduction histidine kinase
MSSARLPVSAVIRKAAGKRKRGAGDMVLKTDSLRHGQLAFIGQLMSGASHEFKNHLAIIRELAGLLADLLAAEGSVTAVNNERYSKIIADIDQRTLMAAEMCRFLSRFSHRMDQPVCSFDVNEILREEIYLLNRFARLKMITLDFNPQSDLPALINNPSLLQFAVFRILTPLFKCLEKNSQLLVSTSAAQDGGVRIGIHCKGAVKDAHPEQFFPPDKDLSAAIEHLGADLDSSFPSLPLGLPEIGMTVPSIRSAE